MESERIPGLLGLYQAKALQDAQCYVQLIAIFGQALQQISWYMLPIKKDYDSQDLPCLREVAISIRERTFDSLQDWDWRDIFPKACHLCKVAMKRC